MKVDLIYTSNDAKIEESGVMHTSISDHSLVYVVWGKSRTSNTKHLYKRSRNFKKFNEAEFCLNLRDTDCSHVNLPANVNQSLKLFSAMFEQICNNHAPIKKHRIKQTTCNLPWLDSEILKLIRERDCLKNRTCKTGIETDWKTYKKMKNYVTNQLRLKKRKVIHDEIQKSKGDVKKTWKTLNLSIPRKKQRLKN